MRQDQIIEMLTREIRQIIETLRNISLSTEQKCEWLQFNHLEFSYHCLYLTVERNAECNHIKVIENIGNYRFIIKRFTLTFSQTF